MEMTVDLGSLVSAGKQLLQEAGRALSEATRQESIARASLTELGLRLQRDLDKLSPLADTYPGVSESLGVMQGLWVESQRKAAYLDALGRDIATVKGAISDAASGRATFRVAQAGAGQRADLCLDMPSLETAPNAVISDLRLVSLPLNIAGQVMPDQSQLAGLGLIVVGILVLVGLATATAGAITVTSYATDADRTRADALKNAADALVAQGAAERAAGLLVDEPTARIRAAAAGGWFSGLMPLALVAGGFIFGPHIIRALRARKGQGG